MSPQHQDMTQNLFEETILAALYEDFEFTNVQDATNVVNMLIAKLQQLNPIDLVVD